MARKSGSSAEKTRPLIAAAALKLFAAHGYSAVSMRQIANEVGVQAGALYLYTPDKQSLLFDLMQRHMVDLLTAWKAADTAVSSSDRLEQFVRFHLQYNLKRADAVFVSYMELRSLDPVNFEIIEDLRRSYETALQQILEQGAAERKLLIADSKLSALAIIAMLTGVNTWYRDGGRLEQNEVADIYVDMVRRLTAQ